MVAKIHNLSPIQTKTNNLPINRKTRTFAQNYPSEKIQDRHHSILGLRGHCYFIVAYFGQSVLPAKLYLHRHLHCGWGYTYGEEMEIRPRVCPVRRGKLYARVPRTDLSREHANGRLLVLPFFWIFRGRSAALRHRQNFRSTIVRTWMVRLCLLDCYDSRFASLQNACKSKKEHRMDTLCHVWPVTCLGRSAHVLGQSQQNHYVLSFRGGERVVLRGRNHPCPNSKRQPRLLQIHLSDNGFPETDELFLLAPHQMR